MRWFLPASWQTLNSIAPRKTGIFRIVTRIPMRSLGLLFILFSVNRWFRVVLFQRSFAIVFIICLGCSAQSVSPDVSKRIEREVRSYYSVPASVTMSLGPLKASEFPNYDALTITLEGSSKKLTYDFLLSKDNKQLMRITKLDLTADPYAAVMKKIDVTGRP